MESQELKNTLQIVKRCLENYPETRSSDDLLYLNVCRICNPETMQHSFLTVLANRKYYKIPSFETVRRSRQKVQRDFPELSAQKHIKEARRENETIFRQFARGALNG